MNFRADFLPDEAEGKGGRQGTQNENGGFGKISPTPFHLSIHIILLYII